MSLQWIVFDAVGTVIYPTPSVAVVYHAIGSQHGSRQSLEEVRRLFRAAFHAASAHEHAGTSEADEELFWRGIVRETLPDVRDLEACFRQLFDHFGRPSAWACFDDVAPTLTELHARGFRLAVASNFDRRLHPLCEELGDGLPLKLFEQRVISSEVGYRKPSSQFYQAVLNMTGARADEVLVVGDDEQNDVDGARHAGLRALHLRRESPLAQSDRELLKRDFIQSLSELVELA